MKETPDATISRGGQSTSEGRRERRGRDEGSPPGTGPRPAGEDQALQTGQEIRFAVVLYGGASLAVYIHGVTQELFHLVRATAPAIPGAFQGRLLLGEGELAGAEGVYRKLGRMLDPTRSEPRAPGSVAESVPVCTRFVVDILSGASAGGVNAVFLAKALATGQRLDGLRRLWIDEGDIGRLLNDRSSTTRPGRGAAPPGKAASLLDGRRLSRLFLEALESMDEGPTAQVAGVSPYLEELDLYVTATDLRGLVRPIRLSDCEVLEKRHRAVFRFIYSTAAAGGEDHNDFTRDYNPFLAFAARATAAFPFAFEPAVLADLEDAARRRLTRKGGQAQGSPPDWGQVFRDYAPVPSGATDPGPETPFPQRAFGDGGTLDNKPFSYVTETLRRRRADSPVQRKLLYVEPSPEHLEEAEVDDFPDAAESVVGALLTLPRSETIREDIEALYRRNRLLERIQRTLGRIQRDVAPKAPGMDPAAARSVDGWADYDLEDMIRLHGVSYGAYHWARVSELTDTLADLLARLAGYAPGSAEREAFRALAKAWRDSRYADRRAGAGSRATQNRFLLDFDLAFRLRRLDFVRGKLDALFPLDAAAEEILHCAGVRRRPTSEEKAPFRQALRDAKAAVNRLYAGLRKVGRDIRSRAENNLLRQEVRAWPGLPAALGRILDRPEKERHNYRSGLYDEIREPFDALMSRLDRTLAAAFTEACAGVTRLLGPGEEAEESRRDPDALVCRALLHYYDYFDSYDMITFPYLLGTDVGESAVVSVVRVSPEDADAVVDERSSGRGKLEGGRLYNFSAFLDKFWRQKDLLWGRLDAAERLVEALLPASAERDDLVREAQAAILREELADFTPTEQSEFYHFCADAGKRTVGGEATAAGPGAATRARRERAGTSRPAGVDPWAGSGRLAVFREVFPEGPPLRVEAPPRPEPESVGQNLSRVVTITGEILGGLARKYEFSPKPASWISRAGQVLWGFVEIALPGRLGHRLFRHWAALVYLFAALMTFGGFLFGVVGVQRVGLRVLLAMALLHLAVALLARRLRRVARRRGFRRLLGFLLFLLVAAGVAGTFLGLQFLREQAWFRTFMGWVNP